MNCYVENKLTPVVDNPRFEKISNEKGDFILMTYNLPRSKRIHTLLIVEKEFDEGLKKCMKH